MGGGGGGANRAFMVSQEIIPRILMFHYIPYFLKYQKCPHSTSTLPP